MIERDLTAAGVILASSRDERLPAARFSGIAFTDDSVVIGEGGLAKYLARRAFSHRDFEDGRFSLFCREGDAHIAKTDATGQDAFFYYRTRGYWALSSSFLALARKVRRDGMPCQVHEPALTPFFLPHSLFEQLVSNNTPIRQIKVLPIGKHIRIGPERTFAIEPSPTPTFERVRSPSAYEQTLVRYVRTWAPRVRALLEHFGDRVAVDITGGRDSRAIFGLLSASGADLSAVNFVSSTARKTDFAVATDLLKTFGLSIRNQWLGKNRVDAPTAYALWKYGNLGTYQLFYRPLGATPATHLGFHGAGGECLRHHYTNSPNQVVAWAKAHFADDRAYRQFKREFVGAFSDLGEDPDDASSMIAHYLHFRSRFHFGRNWFRNLSGYLVTPLASKALIGAARWLPEDALKSAQLSCDLMLATCPALTRHRFDDEKKAVSRAMLARSPFREGPAGLDGPLPTVEVLAADETEAPRVGKPASDAQMTELLLADVERARAFGKRLRLFSEDDFEEAIANLRDGSRLVMGARKAVHILTAAECLELAS